MVLGRLSNEDHYIAYAGSTGKKNVKRIEALEGPDLDVVYACMK